MYEPIFYTVVPVNSTKVEEMVKLYENCQSTIAMAYANEMAVACVPFGVDPFKAAKAAAIKLFGYLTIFSSIGIGCHCIPVNATYFMPTCNLPLLQQAHERISTRPSRIASRLLAPLLNGNHQLRSTNHQPRRLVVGLGFKAPV